MVSSFRLVGPLRPILCARLMIRSTIASASVDSPSNWCQCLGSTWLVMMVMRLLHLLISDSYFCRKK